ncbi:CBO0543 family protein [Niallia oryzisoli]|uniref:CBO0543 family protein n=1 Tax=Niallia oryzisoli TaxID=1737571 RepID=UPI003736CB58
MKISYEKKIEMASWFIMSFLLLKYVKRNRLREAEVIFFSKQFLTWIFGLLVVEKRLISYPSRLFFKNATKTSFTFEYFIYPALCVLFNLYYPEKRSSLVKLVYYAAYSSVITSLELIAVKYTRLITYKKWKWYWTFSTLWFTFYLSHLNHKWFFKESYQKPSSY